MRRFLASTALLTLLISGTLGLARFSAVPGPLPGKLALLDPGECAMPCWGGVRPGVTTTLEAVRLLLSNPLIDPKSIRPLCDTCRAFILNWKDAANRAPNIPSIVPEYDMLVAPLEAVDMVGSLTLRVDVTVGDLLLEFGNPQQVRVGVSSPVPGNNVFQIYSYPQLGMTYALYTTCLRNQHPAALRGIYYTLAPLDNQPILGGDVVNQHWHGLSDHELNSAIAISRCRL